MQWISSCIVHTQTMQGILPHAKANNKTLYIKWVLQGDTLSSIMFLVELNPLIQFIKYKIIFGYDPNATKYISTPFADDFDLITTYSKPHPHIINNIVPYANSMNLTLNQLSVNFFHYAKVSPQKNIQNQIRP